MGAPDAKGVISGAEEVCGTSAILKTEQEGDNISYATVLSTFKKTYSSAALFGWFCGYGVLAASVAGGFITCSWELSGVTASYFTAPIMAIFVFTTALIRGEFRKVWAYKEDWDAAPSLEDGLEAPEDASGEVKEEQSEKKDTDVLISVE